MTLVEIVDRASDQLGSQSNLAKRMGVLPWAISQWRYGLTFPAPDREVLLAELAGVEPSVVREAIWEARRAKWEQRRAMRRPVRSPDTRVSPPRRGLAKALPHRPRPAHAHATAGGR